MAKPDTKPVLSFVEQAVDRLPAALRKAKIKRSCFTTTELWEVLFDTEPSKGSITELGWALSRAGYEKFRGGYVVRISATHGSNRYWIVQRREHEWTPAQVRADVKTNPL